jgi:hypothetical protein
MTTTQQRITIPEDLDQLYSDLADVSGFSKPALIGLGARHGFDGVRRVVLNEPPMEDVEAHRPYIGGKPYKTLFTRKGKAGR